MTDENHNLSVNFMIVVVIEDRIPSYMTINVDDINAMLNHEDVSEYLKIGPNGLEVTTVCCSNLAPGLDKMSDMS